MHNIDLRLFDVVFMIDGLGDVDGDDDIGFEVGEDEDDVKYEGEEDEDDDGVDVKNDGKDDDVSSLNIVSKDAIKKYATCLFVNLISVYSIDP